MHGVPRTSLQQQNWDLPDELSEQIGERFEALQEERGFDYFEVATTQQSKVGGYPSWTRPPGSKRPDELTGRPAGRPAENGTGIVTLTGGDDAVSYGIHATRPCPALDSARTGGRPHRYGPGRLGRRRGGAIGRGAGGGPPGWAGHRVGVGIGLVGLEGDLADGTRIDEVVPGVTLHGEDVGGWLTTQQRDFGKLNEEQRRRLGRLGVNPMTQSAPPEGGALWLCVPVRAGGSGALHQVVD
ncbi:helicase associated domain-containing protein [Streptomyces nojiriensis]|uniref:hypothetical protein n=1 Tax=Streptomyces nojiriensis TaxID=66374 RepID=UPI002E1810E3